MLTPGSVQRDDARVVCAAPVPTMPSARSVKSTRRRRESAMFISFFFTRFYNHGALSTSQREAPG